MIQITIEQMNTQLNRIENCLRLLSEEDVWRKLSPDTNSIANLCVHLAGNEYQHFVSGIGEQPFIRQRSQEFNIVEGLSKQQLLDELKGVREQSIQILSKLTATDLDRQVKVYFDQEDWKRMKERMDASSEPCFIRSIQDHLFIVAEHYGYHTGQIVYITKLIDKNRGNITEYRH
ncbi:MAG: DUF1572 family protein [Paenibacillaceae bacterium]